MTVDINDYFTRIEPYLHLGCSLYDSCVQAEVPYSTILDYQKKDVEIREKIERAKHYATVAARKNMVTSINSGDKDASKWWLERKCRDEFSTKTEQASTVTHEGGIELDVKKENVAKKLVTALSSLKSREAE